MAKTHSVQFLADGTQNLITRLHHNVIRTGLRRINLAYSKISLADIAAKLHLASADDAGEGYGFYTWGVLHFGCSFPQVLGVRASS